MCRSGLTGSENCPSLVLEYVCIHVRDRECLDLPERFAVGGVCGSTFKPSRTWLGLVAKLGSVIRLFLKKLDLDKWPLNSKK